MPSYSLCVTKKSSEIQDFTEAAYIQYLELALERWNPSTFQASVGLDEFLIWRHDVDYSLNRALSLAKIEKAMGVKAHYFLRSRGNAYSILEKSQRELVLEIYGLGHSVGIHLEANDLNIETEQDLETALDWERSLFRHEFAIDIDSFSFHNPTSETLKFNANMYAGLVNAYGKRYFESVEYVSDSNGYWRHKNLGNVLRDDSVKCIQVLTHPEWWQIEQMSPFSRIKRCAEGRENAFIQKYVQELEDSGRVNVGG